MNSFLKLFCLGAFLFSTNPTVAEERAHFSDGPKVVLGEDGREVILLEDYSYNDSQRRSWQVHAGYVANGASIPRVFWSFTGGPLAGRYRNASIIHDYFCEFRGPSSDQVHTMFYEAMLTGGVPKRKAWVMYKAVDVFGSNWEIIDEKVPEECKDGDNFDPSKCVFNDSLATIDTTVEATPERLTAFFSELETQGYAEEVQQLRQSAAEAGMQVAQ